MVRRTAKTGPNASKSFWGCSAYPNCTATRPIVTETSPSGPTRLTRPTRPTNA
jgi:hypothetical protein